MDNFWTFWTKRKEKIFFSCICAFFFVPLRPILIWRIVRSFVRVHMVMVFLLLCSFTGRAEDGIQHSAFSRQTSDSIQPSAISRQLSDSIQPLDSIQHSAISRQISDSTQVDSIAEQKPKVKKGTLTIANSVAFGDGASFVVDSLPASGVVLTSKVITTNGVLSVSVMGDSRSYVATIVDNGDSTVSLVFEKAPLPANVNASITVRYWGDDGWEDRKLNFDLLTAWITNYYSTLETVEAVAAKYDEDAANGAKVWQCYMLGLDPTDAASSVSLSMSVAGNEIRFAVEGLGETHPLDGIQVYWYMKTSTNLVTDASFSKTRDSAQGLPPTFGVHDMPDKPTGKTTEPVADALFYKISVLFVAEDGD